MKNSFLISYLKGFLELNFSSNQRKFYKWQLDNSKNVKIQSYKSNPQLKKMIDDLLEDWSPEIKQCYRNAFRVCSRCKGVKYEEGHALSIIPMSHAWNSYRGIHFDITSEILFKEKPLATEYLGIISLGLKQAMKLALETNFYGEWLGHVFLKKLKKK